MIRVLDRTWDTARSGHLSPLDHAQATLPLCTWREGHERPPPAPGEPLGEPLVNTCLFNISDDPGRLTNIAKSNPDVVQRPETLGWLPIGQSRPVPAPRSGPRPLHGRTAAADGYDFRSGASGVQTADGCCCAGAGVMTALCFMRVTVAPALPMAGFVTLEDNPFVSQSVLAKSAPSGAQPARPRTRPSSAARQHRPSRRTSGFQRAVSSSSLLTFASRAPWTCSSSRPAVRPGKKLGMAGQGEVFLQRLSRGDPAWVDQHLPGARPQRLGCTGQR